MNKKLLLTVLAAGLVFPTATANAKEFIVDANGNKQLVEKGGQNLISSLGADDKITKELDALKKAEAEAKAKAAEAEAKAKEEAARLAALNNGLKAQGSVDLTPKSEATTKAGETSKGASVTAEKPAIGLDGKTLPKSPKATPKKVSAKKGTKTLPKTSAVK